MQEGKKEKKEKKKKEKKRKKKKRKKSFVVALMSEDKVKPEYILKWFSSGRRMKPGPGCCVSSTASTAD